MSLLEKRKTWVGVGYDFGLGLLWLVLVMAISSTAWTWVKDKAGWGENDDTDAAYGQHSGLKPLTDALTGCQYLRAGDAMIPRMDAAGKHICRVVKP